jgi:exopolyphosphatase
MRFSSFIRRSRSLLTSTNSAILTHFVIGNEACDCDSAISALAYAYRLASLTKSPSLQIQIVPVISCFRRDWPLRREAQDLLTRCMQHDTTFNKSIALEEDLVFIDDVVAALSRTTTSGGNERQVTVTLVDHNVLKGPLALALDGIGINPETSVIEIVDHHIDSGRHAHVVGTKRNIAFDATSFSATAGSTCTLVAYDLLNDAHLSFLSTVDGTSNFDQQYGLDANLAEVLGSCILLDTVGLDMSAGKATPLDFETISRLRALIASERKVEESTQLDTKAVFQRLMSLKQDPSFWRSLTVQQALEFDFKSFEMGPSSAFGTSSIMASVTDFLRGWEANDATSKQPYRLSDCADFVTTKGLSFQVILSAVSVENKQEGGLGGLERGLAIIAIAGTTGAELAERVCSTLLKKSTEEKEIIEKSIDLQLELEEVHVENDNAMIYVRVFKQGNRKASRKQLAPLLQQICCR